MLPIVLFVLVAWAIVGLTAALVMALLRSGSRLSGQVGPAETGRREAPRHRRRRVDIPTGAWSEEPPLSPAESAVHDRRPSGRRVRARRGISRARRGEREPRWRDPLVEWRVMERDGWRCQLCDNPIRYNDPDTDLEPPEPPRRAEIDHILPRKHGGCDGPAPEIWAV